MKYRTKAGVVVEAERSVVGGKAVYLIDYSDGLEDYIESMFEIPFNRLFEPADTEPAEDGTVRVGRRLIENAANYLAAEDFCATAAALRSALSWQGEKVECKHDGTVVTTWDAGLTKTVACQQCGMVRLLGDWTKGGER